MTDTLLTSRHRDTRQELARLLLEKKRRRGMRDLRFLAKHVLDYVDVGESGSFHDDYCKHLEDDDYLFKLTLTPRGSLKSTIGTVTDTIRDLIRYPNSRTLLASEKFSISTKFLGEIKGHLENNDKFKRLYGNLKSDLKWTESEIIISTRTSWKASPTVACAGIDVTKVGMHYDVIRVDDPHSDQNTTNQDQIDKVIRWYKLLLSLLDPGGRLYITGTIWHYNDLYNYIQLKERERLAAGRKPRFRIFKRDSFSGTNDDLMNDRIEESDLLWPERLSAEFLKDQYIEQGPYIFSCQYRLNPIDDDTATFKRSWMVRCHPSEVPSNLSVFSTVDPMRDEEGKDFLAITTCGLDRDWKAYILDVRNVKADEHDTIEELYDVWKKWKPSKIGIESVLFQKSYIQYVKLLQMMKGYNLPIRELKIDVGKPKRMRITSMVPYFKAGLFVIPCVDDSPQWLNTLTGGMATLVDQLTRYPKVGNDDCADALSMMNLITHRPNVLAILNKQNPKSFMAVRAKRIKQHGHSNKLGAHNVRRSYAQEA